MKAYRPVAETGGAYYQIAYRVKGTETWTYVTTYLQKKTISDLKSGKTYEFKERAYKTVDGIKYYGNWSAVKTITVK